MTSTAERNTSSIRSLSLAAGSAIGLAAYLVGVLLGAFGAYTSNARLISPDPTPQSAFDLFRNNAGVLVLLSGGAVTLGILTIAVLAFNGMLLGWVVVTEAMAGQAHTVVTGILPHLALELGAYVLSAGATLRLAVALLGRIRRRSQPLPPGTLNGWLKVQAAAVALLVVAAVVEASFAHV